MKKYSRGLVLIACLCSLQAFALEVKPKPDDVIGQAEMSKSTKLATDHVREHLRGEKNTGRTAYRMIAAQNLLQKGTAVWLVTFKPTNLIPKDPGEQPIGLGGEIFVTVDLTTKKCVITYGE